MGHSNGFVGIESVTLRIEDDGDGFVYEAEQRSQHFGLSIMRERAERLGGAFDVVSELGKGTMILAKLPLHPQIYLGSNLEL